MRKRLFVLALYFFGFHAPAWSQDAGEYPLRIDRIKSGQDIQFIAVNDGLARVTLSFGLSGENFRADRQLPLALVVAPRSRREIVRISQVKRWEAIRVSYTHSFNAGDAFTPPDQGYRYRLPFAKGTSAQIVQEPGGTLITHDNASTRHAIDFGVPEGTLVSAAREGVVIDAKDAFTEGRPDPSLRERANFVAVMHADHSIAHYLHLAPKRVLVRPGDKLRAGDAIGYSGNTGYSFGPHLHFDVRRAVLGEGGEVSQESIPVVFYRRASGAKITLREGMRIEAD